MTVKDQMGRTVRIKKPVRRIVSLVPSITELLVDLGLQNEIVGITKFCVHPASLKRDKSIIGGTKNIKISDIIALKPDLVIANKEENDPEQVENLSNHVPVYVSDIQSYEDNIQMIRDLSVHIHTPHIAAEVIRDLRAKQPSYLFNQQTVLYLIWQEPYMSIGQDTYIHHVLESLGLENIMNESLRYPKIELSDIQQMSPDYIFLSSEPYPFQTKHLDKLARLAPESKVILVDGEAFSWYGTRILKLGQYFQNLKSELI